MRQEITFGVWEPGWLLLPHLLHKETTVSHTVLEHLSLKLSDQGKLCAHK